MVHLTDSHPELIFLSSGIVTVRVESRPKCRVINIIAAAVITAADDDKSGENGAKLGQGTVIVCGFDSLIAVSITGGSPFCTSDAGPVCFGQLARVTATWHSAASNHQLAACCATRSVALKAPCSYITIQSLSKSRHGKF